MRSTVLNISLFLLAALMMLSCDRTPGGVLSVNDMADLIVDMQLAEAYIDNNISEFPSDSSKQVIKQSIFKKHGITQQDYDSSLVWYAHNMEDYVKAYDKAVGKLKDKQEKLNKSNGNGSNMNNKAESILAEGPAQGERTHSTPP